MTKILVTGANGQLGSELQKIQSEFSNFEFVFTDSKFLDITHKASIESVFAKDKFNFVINCAAYTAVDKAESEPGLANKINSLGVRLLSEVATFHGCKLIHISTDYVFDGVLKNTPFSEQDKEEPLSVYGQSKFEGESQLAKNKNAIIIRTSWLYSSFGNNFMKTMLRLGSDRNNLNVVCDQVGTPTYAQDLAFSILEIIKRVTQDECDFIPGVYHFSNEGVCSWYDFAVEIMKMGNLNCKVFPIDSSEYPTPAKRPHYSVLNKNKIKNTFNIEISHWRESAIRCFEEINKK